MNDSQIILRKFFQHAKVATIDEIKSCINSEVEMTVHRKLKEVGYLTSYSHNGRYYTLQGIPDFNKSGLWSFNDIQFSIFNTLGNTCIQLINKADSGHAIKELSEKLKVEVRLAALNLFKQKKVFREQIDGELVYFSVDKSIRKKQVELRMAQNKSKVFSINALSPSIITSELKASVVLFYSLLNEKQRRLYAGIESLKLGYGGDKLVAELLGLHPDTVRRGRQELSEEHVETESVRTAGGGRKTSKKKRPN